MKIRSWCSITLGGVDILLPDDWLEDDLIPPARMVAYQAADYFRAPFSDQINRNLVKHTFSFTRVRRLGNGLSARHFGLQHMGVLPLEPSDCYIRGVAGGVWLLSRADLAPIQPNDYADLFNATNAVSGGQYSTVAPGPAQTDSDLPGAEDGPANIVDGSGNRLVDESGNEITG